MEMDTEGSSIAVDGFYYEPDLWNWEEIWLAGNNITCSIWVEGGNTIIDEANKTITINTHKNANVGISAWLEMTFTEEYSTEPWYDDLEYDDRDIVGTAIEEGDLAAVGYLFVNDGGDDWSKFDAFNDPSFQMTFTNVANDEFEVQVESHIHEGRIVSININKEALNASDISDLLVRMDGGEIKAYDSLEELTQIQGGTEAGYYASFGDTQTTLFVYVPHFSSHTITVQSIYGLVPNIIVPGILAIAFTIMAVVAVIQHGRRGQKEE
jgi:hypothetical protein